MMLLPNIACTTCAQVFEHVGDDAAGWAILFMLVVLVFVLGTIGFVIRHLSNRAQMHFDPQFQDPYES